MTVGERFLPLFLFLFLEDVSLSAAQVKAPQPREGDIWHFQVSHKDWINYHFTIFGTPAECARLLKGYTEAGLTTIIARIASDDGRAQARLLLNEIKPQLA